MGGGWSKELNMMSVRLKMSEKVVEANCKGGTEGSAQTRVGGIKFQRPLTAFGRETDAGLAKCQTGCEVTLQRHKCPTFKAFISGITQIPYKWLPLF